MTVEPIVFFTTLFATTLSAMSGGGASAINLPVFLALGIPFPLATATQKVSSTFWVLPAAYNFLKGRSVDWFFLLTFAFLGLIGAYVGVVAVINTDQRVMEIVVGALILSLVVYTYFKKDIGARERPLYSPLRRAMAYPVALLLGFYESIFGAGNGILFAITSLYTRGFDFIDALGYYFSVAFFWCVFAAGLLIAKGYFDLSIMIPAVAGSVIGGYAGSKFARYKGNQFIRIMYVIFGGVLGLKLLLGF